MRTYLLYQNNRFIGAKEDGHAAQTMALQTAGNSDAAVDVVKVDDRIGSRRVRYHPDGRVEQLWKEAGDGNAKESL